MRRPSILTTALLATAGLVLFAGDASAQGTAAPTGESLGLRYLSWSGRGEVAPANPAAAPAPSGPTRRDLRRPNAVIPHGGFAASAPAPARPGLTPAPGGRRTLTPANAWQPPVVATPAPLMAQPAMAQPAMTRPAMPRPAMPRPVAPPPPAPAPQPRAMPDYLPDSSGRGQAIPAEMIFAPTPPAAPVAAQSVDPMAPRRDAPIFRMQQDAPVAVPPVSSPSPAAVRPVVQPAAASPGAAPRPRRIAEVSNSDQRPPQQGGRYYSVHRQNGRQPDGLVMPEPTYVDALVVTMSEPIASQDLAAPEPGPTLIRDQQGRVRPAPPASDGDHQ